MSDRDVGFAGIGVGIVTVFLVIVFEMPQEIAIGGLVLGCLITGYAVRRPLVAIPVAGVRAVKAAPRIRLTLATRGTTILTVGEVSWEHDSYQIYADRPVHSVQLDMSVRAGSRAATVVRFRLTTPGKTDVYGAEYYLRERDGLPLLRSAILASSSVAGHHERWLNCPIPLEPGGVEAGWIGFIVPYEYEVTYGYVRDRGMTLIAELADGKSVSAKLPPPRIDPTPEPPSDSGSPDEPK